MALGESLMLTCLILLIILILRAPKSTWMECSSAGPCLVSFYLSNEVFLVTPISSDEDDCFDVGAKWINLAVLNGSIALYSFYKETTTFHVSILGELGIKESWTKLFIVGPLACVKRPIIVGTKGEIFFIRKDMEVAWFDLSMQMIEQLGYKAESLRCKIVNYKVSILPVLKKKKRKHSSIRGISS